MSYYVYILSNHTNSVLYIGVTNDLVRRAYEHKNKLVEGFTRKYNVSKLVYFEMFEDPVSAIEREKQLKGGSRTAKVNLIMKNNNQFKDLYERIL